MLFRSRVLGLPDGVGTLKPGAPADIAVLDLDREWIVDRNRVQSRSNNTPFHGMKVWGKAVFTVVGGKVIRI